MFATTSRGVPEREKRYSRLWWVLLLGALLVACSAASAAAAASDPPVAEDDYFTTKENHRLVVGAPGVLRNDEGPATLTAAKLTNPRHGRLTLDSDGSFVYTPRRGYRGGDSFTYRADDGAGGSDEATVRVRVRRMDGEPRARDDNYRTDEDHSLTVPAPGILGNDTGGKVLMTSVSSPRHGSLNLNRDGSFTYTPEADYDGRDYFTYKTQRGDHRSNFATVIITVNPVNDAPAYTGAARNTSQTIDEGTSLAALEATDVDGDDLTFKRTGGTLPAGITLEDDGSFSGVAGGRAAGNYTASIKVSDGNGESATTNLAVAVNAVEQAPVAEGEDVTTDEDVAKVVTLSATDPDSDNLTFSVSSAGHGTLGAVSAPNCSTSAAGTATCTAAVEYTPHADYNGPDSFTYKANDGSSDSASATVNITVNSINDAPVASGDTKTTPENTPLILPASDLLSNDSAGAANESGQHLHISEVSNPPDGVGIGHGNAVLNNDGSVTFTPDANYNGDASFEYTVCDDGSPQKCSTQMATVNVTVSPVNSTPTSSATPASLDIDEDAAAQTITLGGADTETGDANLRFTITEAPTHGTLKKDTTVLGDGDTFTGSPSDVTYKPDADYNGEDSFTFKVTDRGDPDDCATPGPGCEAAKDSDLETVQITVHPVNDAPVFDLGADQTVENTAGAQTVSGFATNISAGPQDESGQTLTFDLTNDDNALFSVQPDIDETSGDLTYTPNENVSGTVTVTASLMDDGDTASGGEDTTTKTFKITVKPPNEPPTASGQSVSTNEDTAKTITLSADDADGDDVTSFSINDPPDHGTLDSIGPITCNAQTPNHCTADVSYKADANYNGTDQFKFTASDAEETSSAATVAITVNPVNDVPVLANVESDALSYMENDPASAITATTTVTDIDSPNFDTGTLTVDLSANGSADDRLEIHNEGADAGEIGVSGSNVTYGGTTIGSFTGGSGTTPLVVTLNANANATATQALVRNITYRNVSENPSSATRTVRFVLTDGDGGTSGPVSRNVSVTAVNDAPTTDPTDAPGSADEQVATNVDSGITVTDPDSSISGATVQITGNYLSSQDVLSFVDTANIKGTFDVSTGKLTLSGADTVANYQAALRSVKYTNTSDTPNTQQRTITFQVTDGGTPPLQSTPQTRGLDVVAINDVPTDTGESQNATGNTRLEVALTSGGSNNPKRTSATGNLLDNASDPDDLHSALSVDLATVSDPPHGTVNVNAGGSYVYTPDAGYTGSDSFTYKVKDAQSAQSAASTVNITVANRVWYVKNDFAGTGDGRSETPFTTLAAADTAADATGDTIYVLRGTGTTGLSDTVDLLGQQRLLGEAVDLVVGGNTLFTGTPANRPPLSGTVNLDDGNTISGVAVAGSGAPAIAGASGDTSGTIADVTLSGGSGGLDLNTTSGTWDLSDLSVNTTGGDAIRAASAGTVNFTGAGTISVSAAAGRGLNLSGTATSGTIDSTTVTSSPSEGIKIDDDTGSLTLDDINLTTTGTGLDIDSSNDVTVKSSGDADISSAGSAVSLTTVTSNPSNMPDVALDQVSSTGGATGINIDDIGNGTFTAAGGTLSDHSGAEINVNNGTGNITYPGTIGNGSGLSARITGRSGGTVALGGNINDTNDTGGGIDMSGNTVGSTVTFSGATKTLNTGANPAFSSTGSNPIINFTNGGLDIDTTSGAGFSATGGGTIVVGTGANPNTIDSTTGTALNVANTTIGAGGLNFKSISVNGASSGIVLNNTGTSGGLTVAGDSGSTKNASGGTIQNTSGQGISLSTTQDVSIDQMNIQNTGGSGIRGTTAVHNFSFTNGTINNSGTGGGNQESNIAFNDPSGSATDAKVTGTVTITGNTLTNALWHGVSILQFAGTLDDVNISNNTITSGTTTGTGGNSFGSGIQLFAGGEASSVASVTRAELNGNNITNFPGGVLMALQGGTSNNSGPVGTYGDPQSSTNDIEVKNNILNGGGTTPDGTGGFLKPNQIILATVNGKGKGNFNIQDNGTNADPLSGSMGNIIDISAGGSPTVKATVSGNKIDASGQTVGGTSGIAAGVGPFTVTGPTTLSSATLYTTVQNNVINNSSGTGIRLNVNAGDPTLNAIVTGNTVGAPISATYGIQVVQGNNAGFTGNTNLQISSNTSTGGTGGGNTFPGIGLRKFGTAQNEFNIVGLSPSPATNAQMESYVSGQNPASASGTFGTGGVAAVNGSSGNWTAIASVPQP